MDFDISTVSPVTASGDPIMDIVSLTDQLHQIQQLLILKSQGKLNGITIDITQLVSSYNQLKQNCITLINALKAELP